MKLILSLFLMFAALGGWWTHYVLALLAPQWSWLRWGISLLSLLALGAQLLTIFARLWLPLWSMRPLVVFGNMWVFVFLYLVMGAVLIGFVMWLPSLRPYILGSKWVALGFVFSVLGLLALGNRKYHSKERVALELTIDKPLSRPLKIVGISDLHLGYTIGRDELRTWVDLINAERPDLILIAGDIVDNDTRPILAEGMQYELSRLSARLGVYAVLGNHEYIGNQMRSRELLAQTSIRLLRDEAVLVDNAFYIVGRDDRTNRDRLSLGELLRPLEASKPILLLDHQPYALEESERQGIDFQLSGHTHRGQVFPINLIVDKMYELSHGYKQRGASHFYVSSGLGLWGGKFRIGTQSEYLVLTLRGI